MIHFFEFVMHRSHLGNGVLQVFGRTMSTKQAAGKAGIRTEDGREGGEIICKSRGRDKTGEMHTGIGGDGTLKRANMFQQFVSQSTAKVRKMRFVS